MAVYSISDLEKLTGIRAHTIRAWEQRYGIIEPRRTAANIRYYQDDDLRELLNIALLNRNGYRISKIARMPPRERSQRIADLTSLNVSPDTQLDALTLSTVEMDEFTFSHIVDTNVQQRGFEETMLEVIYPFLDKLGVLYFTGSIAPVQEALISNLIRQKILAATDRLPPRPREPAAPTFALYLPEGERQELSLLFIQYLLRKRGFPTVYLGPDTAPKDLGDAARCTHLDYLFTVATTGFAAVREHCPDSTLLVSGPFTEQLAQRTAADERVRYIRGLREMLDFLDTITPAP